MRKQHVRWAASGRRGPRGPGRGSGPGAGRLCLHHRFLQERGTYKTLQSALSQRHLHPEQRPFGEAFNITSDVQRE